MGSWFYLHENKKNHFLVVWVLFTVFVINCITSFGDCTHLYPFLIYLWSQATATPTAVCGQSRYWFSSQHSFMVCSVWSHDTEAEEITLDICKNERTNSKDKFSQKTYWVLSRKTQFAIDFSCLVSSGFGQVFKVIRADIVTTLETRDFFLAVSPSVASTVGWRYVDELSATKHPGESVKNKN